MSKLWFTYCPASSRCVSQHGQRKAMGETVPRLEACRGRARAVRPLAIGELPTHAHRHCSFPFFFFICSGTIFSGRKIGLSDGQKGNMSG